MIPSNRLSSTPVLDDWSIAKDDEEFTKQEGFVFGPSYIGDTDSALDVEIWRYTYALNMVYMTKMSTMEVFPLNNDIVNATEISACFNQSAQPVSAFVSGGVCFLKWYDTSINDYVVENLGAGFSSPKIILDIPDKKSSQSDVIFFYYLNSTKLCCRYQRDRYSIEYQLKDMPPHRILRVGHNKSNRIQFLVEEVL